MKHKIIVLLPIFIFIFTSVFCKEIPLKDAQIAALNWRQHINPLKKGATEIDRAKTSVYNGVSTFYTFTFKGGGFVIVSADDNAAPILGYSDDSFMPSEITNESVKYWLSKYDEQVYDIIAICKQQTGFINQSAKQEWGNLLNNTFSLEKSGKGTVGPLLTTKWDQGCYYNTSCPADNDGPCSHAYVGCVAVAMAQVMNYHNYPYSGTGTHTYTSYEYGKQTADFGNTHYKWEDMPDSLIASNAEVTRLMYHCGVAVDMDYSASGSGAFDKDIQYALRAYFNYPYAALYDRNSNSETDWIACLKTQLNNHYPVIYCGFPSYGWGHSFVCDGYDASGMFHFNWGWSGNCDGYFLISNLNPSGRNYNYDQTAIMWVCPYKPMPVADFTSDEKYINAGSSISFTDKSYYATKWEWSFPGGTPSTSTLQNPTVTYTKPGTYSVTLKATNYYGSNSKTINNYYVFDPYLVICENLNSPFPGTPTLVGATGGGWMAGTNSYKDKAKADYFVNYPDDRNLTGAQFKFGVAINASGTDPDITFCVWDNTGTNGMPGKIISSQTLPMSSIVTDVSKQQATWVSFPAPVKITAPYYVGVVLPTTAEDQLALYCDKNGETLTNMAFEQTSSGNWYDFSSWGYGAYKLLDLYIQPRFCTPNIPFELNIDKDSTICEGKTITIKSSIKGGNPPYTYSWSSGESTPFINITPAEITTYMLTVTDSRSNTLKDSTTVYAYPVPLITEQPASQVVCEGQSAMLSLGISGGQGCFYNWQVSTDLGQTYTDIPVTEPIFMMMPYYKTPKASIDLNYNKYKCIVTSPCGITLTSSVATLTVNFPPKINTQPMSIAICPGNTAAFSVSTSGSLLSYQWQLSTDGGTVYSDILNSTLSKIRIGSITTGMNNYHYRCVVRGYCFPYLTSNPAILTIDNNCNICTTLNYPLPGTPKCYPTAKGWMTGTNEYKVTDYAEYFNSYPDSYNITGVKVYFAHPAGTATHEATISIYNNDNGEPGMEQTSQTITLGTIMQNVANSEWSQVTFPTPVTVNGSFFVVVTLPSGTGDVLAIYSNTKGNSNPSGGYLYYNSTWYSFSDNPLGPFLINLGISPTLCKECPSLNPAVQTSRSPVICQGEALALSAMTEYNVFYQWMKDDINITGATNSVYTTTLAGVYKVKVKNADSCSAVSPSVTVAVNPLPMPSLGADRTIYTNQTIALEPGSNFKSYLWNNGTIDPYLDIKGSELSQGTYTYSVIVTDNNGCSANTSVNVKVTSNFYSLSGKITYYNSSNTPIVNAKVILANMEGYNTDSIYSDANGNYQFANLQSKSYTLILKPANMFGGSDPIDALLINRSFIGIYSITDKLRNQAADVNIDNKINPTDALFVNRRYVQIITSFKQKDWIFEPKSIYVGDINTVCNIICICSGDVNASYNPVY